MSKTKEQKSASEETVKAVKPFSTLAELTQLCQQKKKVKFDYCQQACEVEIRKLTPHETARVNEIVESVTPAVIRGKTPEEDRLDLANADFIKRKNAAAVKARALALYLAVPEFNQAKPNLTDLDSIRDFIQGQLTEDILHALWQGITGADVELAELVNFT